MKRISLLLASLLCAALLLCSCDFGFGDFDLDDLNDLASMLEEQLSELENNIPDEGAESSYPQGADADGNITEVLDEHTEKLSHYDRTGSLVFYHIITYDDDRRVANKTAYDAVGGEMGNYDYAYNENGDWTEGAWFMWDLGFLMKTERTYDENGVLTEDWWHGSDAHNVVGNRRYYHYKDNGKIDYIIYYSTWYENGTHGEPRYDRYVYNDLDQCIRIDSVSEAEVLMFYVEMEYDEAGRKITETSCNQDGSVDYKYVYKYDDSGKLIAEERYDGRGNLVSVDQH